MSPYPVSDVANWFLATAKAENKPLRPMKLQKLVYFAYGWYYAYYDKPLFDETIYAFRHGPVVKELFERFRDLKGNPIEEAVQKPTLDEKVEPLLEHVWKAYSIYTDIELSETTHSHAPWIDAYSSEEWFAVMQPETIHGYFKHMLETV